MYRPKTVEGRIHDTGWPLDGCIARLSLWDYDDYEYYHLDRCSGKDIQLEAKTMFLTEQEAGMCLYDTWEEFWAHWDEWEPDGVFCIPLDKVEVIRVINEELSGTDISVKSEKVIRHYALHRLAFEEHEEWTHGVPAFAWVDSNEDIYILYKDGYCWRYNDSSMERVKKGEF